eukprot:TRINITY_DN32714_c0_g1_i1.p4 TRINITY_DN32714_c0_g1~~TRINITY_DN32714_c0_g1_i1.p4  ORF type:complete len:132 (-),score=28.92 TRINITY_DN32714_c0_g1_i1:47-442(-)
MRVVKWKTITVFRGEDMTRKLFDVPQFMASLAEDEELARELIAAFLEDGPKRVVALSDALAAEDAEGVSRLAHSLKGMCGVVHAGSLAEMALNMEYASRGGDLTVVRERFDELKTLFEQVSARMQQYLNGN